MDRPSLADVAQRLGVSDTDPVLTSCYWAAWEQQCEACVTQPYSDALAEALVRRTSNNWASKAHTLGVYDTGDSFGIQYVPQWDPVVDALERHRRKIAVA